MSFFDKQPVKEFVGRCKTNLHLQCSIFIWVLILILGIYVVLVGGSR